MKNLVACCTLLSGVAWAVTPVAKDSLAGRVSPEWRALAGEVRALELALARLPRIPVEDYGGTRPFLRVFSTPGSMEDLRIDFTIRLRWPKPCPVDFVALVPARKIDSMGLDPNYGFPEDFTVSLIGPDGALLPLDSHTSTSAMPAHRGHPIVSRASGQPVASGLEVHISRARQPRPGAPALVIVALAEIFCYSGDHNVAADSTVEIASKGTAELPSFWSPELLIDGVTPLGLPERPSPAGETENIGWLSRSRHSADEGLSIRLDLGTPRRIDGLRLFPALRPSIGDFPGFGIPARFRLLGGKSADASNVAILLDHTSEATPDAGHNPHEFHFPPAEVRFVELEAVQLWKPYPFYPAFLAFSEIQILGGDEVVSQGAKVSVPEETKPVAAQGSLMWSPESLTDNRGPEGVLISRRYWIEDLDQRLTHETRRHEALERMDQLEVAWQRGTLATATTLAMIGLGFAVVLPSRYRRRERRRIREVRQRIAGDLHDDVGSNLGSIQMLSAMAREKTDNREELETIHRVAAETVNSVRDIVWLLHPIKAGRVPAIDHLRESAAILLDPLEWSLESDFRDWQLGDEDSRHLLLFFREALHNIHRHAAASTVSIHVGMEGESFLLAITDNGRGIPPERLDQPTSLRALNQRADRLGGTVTVVTEEGKGTTITLRFVPRLPGSEQSPIPYSEDQ